jgi:3-hydroxyacyl-CoA dehydrogenase
MSPLELIDRIGIRTAFDSGRVFWRAFPKRIDPAPILPGMIKAGRLGAVAGGGFFDPARIDEKPGDSHPVDPIAQAVIARYAREARVWDLDEVVVHLAAPMWIEAAEILADRVVRSTESIELGLRGGLGYRRDFIPFCDSLGGSMLKVIRENSGAAAFNAGQVLIELLEGGHSPASALNRYAGF